MEVSVGAKGELDFAELLDDLLAASVEAREEDDEDCAAPALRVDLLAQIERLEAHSRPVFVDRAVKEYGDIAEGGAPKAEAPNTEAGKTESGKTGTGKAAAGKAQPTPGVRSTPDLQPALDDLFFLDPQSISRELGLEGKPSAEALDRARRSFALRYHPDRVPEAMRERAVLRMQIANMLIDEAKRRAR